VKWETNSIYSRQQFIILKLLLIIILVIKIDKLRIAFMN